MRESDLLDHIYKANAALPAAVSIGPGDDMGAVRFGDCQVLTTIDQVADGVHVDLQSTPLEKVGRKAMTRNLSDVAAMGAVPIGAVVAACLPRDFGSDRATAMFDAMRRTGQAYDCPLFGGDVAMWDQRLLLTVTILAGGDGVDPVLRKGAQVGDAVCVTGQLGGSLETVDGYTHHLDFEPRLKIARALAASDSARPHCMIDLSDGLAVDLGHLCRASNAAAVIDADQLPISPAAETASKRDGKPSWQHAIGDGEDYELCFTVSDGQAQQLTRQPMQGVAITRIGRIVEADADHGQAAVSLKLPDGSSQNVTGSGWEHQA